MSFEKYLKKLTRLEDAIKLASSVIKPSLEVVEYELDNALNAVLAEDVVCREDIPPLNRSEVDGYAVRSRDLVGASSETPVKLKLGSECVYVSTGEYLPDGFDSVVMVEETLVREGYVYFYREVKPFENVSLKGSDFKKGELLLKRGSTLSEFDLMALASINKSFVKAYRKPLIGILNIGSELVPLGSNLGGNQKINSNEVLLTQLLKTFGLTGLKMGIVKDEVEEVAERLIECSRLCDLMITTGGTAVSDRDVALDAVKAAGGEVIVRGLAIRPGRPTSFGLINGKPVFLLSGNPVACAIGLIYFTLPVIVKAFRHRGLTLPRVKAKLSRRVVGRVGYKCFVRVKLKSLSESTYLAEPVSTHGAGMISTLINADGFLIIPEDLEGYDVGEVVEIEVFRWLNEEEDI